MTFYLLEKPVQGPTKWYTTRRKPIQGVTVHVTAGLEDLDSTADNSAEATAEYCRTTDRAVSWHAGADTDTRIHLLPPSYTAFHCAGFNSSTLGIEISKRHTDWFGMSPEWVRNTLRNAAQVVADWWPILYAEGVPLVKVTRAEWDNGAKGFISHHELDPARRSDPGWHKGKDTFPWQQFFDAIAAAITPPQEDDDVAFRYDAIQHTDTKAIALTAAGFFKHVTEEEWKLAKGKGWCGDYQTANAREWDLARALAFGGEEPEAARAAD